MENTVAQIKQTRLRLQFGLMHKEQTLNKHNKSMMLFLIVQWDEMDAYWYSISPV